MEQTLIAQSGITELPVERRTSGQSLSTDGFGIIYADPPWEYKDKANAGKRGAGYKYTVTGTDAICSIPVSCIAAKDCTLFMWATFPMLADAMKVMQAWGFEYKTAAFVWVKRNKKADTDFMGMGNWTRANAELCLLGVKGKPKRVSASVRQVIRSPIARHSEKPHEVRERIVELMGDLPRLELFARTKATGWEVWGNEVENYIEMVSNEKCPSVPTSAGCIMRIAS